MGVNLSIEGGLAEIVLNRPDKMNALNDAMVAELNACLDRAESEHVRALILRGEGPAFSAGRDLGDADEGNEDAEAIIETTFNPMVKRIATFPAPTFASVHGACLGAGLGLALACDVVYIADDAKIGSPFARIGAVLDSGGHWFFVSRVGAHRALELIYHGPADFRKGSGGDRAGESEHAQRGAARVYEKGSGACGARTDRGVHAIKADRAADR